ncbi:MAG: hypothetical protein ACYDGM_07460 [Vulcanimicrobiaceae bacterium]
MEHVLESALLAEREHRWIESHSLCRQALANAPENPDALNLLGRLCGRAGDASRAIGLQRFVLRIAPGHTFAPGDLAIALGAVQSPQAAQRAYEDALEIEPDIAQHHLLPGSQHRFVGMERAEALLRRAVELDPSSAPVQAALGNIALRNLTPFAALRAYETAVLLDWEFSDAHLRLATLLEAARDDVNAALHYREAFARKQIYVARDRSAVRRVLVLKEPEKARKNTPIDFLVNHARTALHVWFVTQDEFPIAQLPDYDVLYCGIDESESSDACVERSIRFIASQAKPVINHPKHLWKVRRSEIHATLQDVAGCSVPQTVRMDREALQKSAESPSATTLEFPLLIRPVDTHRGDGLERISDAREIASYLTRFPDEYFTVSPFIDYRSADGWYRKYRVIVVGGKPFAYHLAISGHWMVHYLSSPMEQHAWMRDEEEQFLRDPQAVFPGWEQTFGSIADAVGMEYFGVDCGRNPDGSILVFEAGPAMLVHCSDPPELFAYKYEYVPRIFDALETLFDRVSGGR